MSQLRTIAALVAAFCLGVGFTSLISGCQQSTSETNVTQDPAPLAEANDDSTDQAVPSDSTASPQQLSSTEKVLGSDAASKKDADEGKTHAVATPERHERVQKAAQEPAKSGSTVKSATGNSSAEPAKEPVTAVVKQEPARAVVAVDKSANPKIVAGDWAQWGGTSYRNNVPIARNIPVQWTIGKIDRRSGEWQKEGSQNIKWVSRLGSQTYGNPVVADGRVYIGTNNMGAYLKRYPSEIDLGVLLCFRESDGAFLWQHSSEKLPTGRVHDWPMQGICCAPYVEGKRLWFVTSRGEVVCLDTEGFHDGEDDGPLQNERGRLFEVVQNEDPAKDKLAGILAALEQGKIEPELAQRFAASGAPLADAVAVKAEQPGKKWSLTGKVGDADRQFQLTLVGLDPSQRLNAAKVISTADKDEADRIWVLDMMSKLQVSQHNMCSCSITALGDLLFINTSNGVDETHVHIPQVDAPSFICVDKNSGEVYWTNKRPGANILHGQWSSPAVATLGGVPQVIFGAGDGWVYSFQADKGKDGKPELLWEFDANPKETKYSVDARSTRNHIIGTPVIYDGLVYVGVGEDPEHGEGDGHLWCIDPTKRGDVSPQLAVTLADRTKVLPKRRLQAIFPDQGEIAIDNPNSAAVWHFAKYDANGDGKLGFEETMHRTCGTVAIKNDLLFVADFSGLFHCLDAKSGKLHWTYDQLAACWGSPLIVGDKVYIGDEDGDIAVFNLLEDPTQAMKEVDKQLVPINADDSGNVINMQNSVYTTPIVANGILFIANKTHLFAIAKPGEEKAAE